MVKLPKKLQNKILSHFYTQVELNDSLLKECFSFSALNTDSDFIDLIKVPNQCPVTF